MLGPDRIIRLKTVLARTGLSRSTIYRKITDPVGWRPKGEFDEVR
jgi:prophage regulatory protein